MIEQAKLKPQETLEIKIDKQMKTFSFNPPINLVHQGKCLLAVSSLEATNSVFNIIDENNSFSITTPGQLNSESAEKVIVELNKLIDLRSENDIDLHVEQVTRKVIILIKNCSLSSLGMFKIEILEEFKISKYKILKIWFIDSN